MHMLLVYCDTMCLNLKSSHTKNAMFNASVTEKVRYMRAARRMHVYSSHIFKDTGTKFEPHFSFVMLKYFRTNQYEEP